MSGDTHDASTRLNQTKKNLKNKKKTRTKEKNVFD